MKLQIVQKSWEIFLINRHLSLVFLTPFYLLKDLLFIQKKNRIKRNETKKTA